MHLSLRLGPCVTPRVATLLCCATRLDEQRVLGPPAAAVDELIDACWPQLAGVIGEEEEARVDAHHLADGEPRPSVDERPSAYGEVTRRGARTLFGAMGLPTARAAAFVDLGSGAGRLVAQCWLELPPETVARAVGVELAPSRHAAALRGMAALAGSGSPLLRHAGSAPPECLLGSMLEADLTAATHVYVSSLCMGDALLDALWTRLAAPGSAPRLQVVATLRAFRAAPPPDSMARVEMSWNRAGAPGAEVYVYRMSEG